MELVEIPHATRTLGKPADWDESVNGPCAVLHIKDTIQQGKWFMLSHWKPTAEELAALNAGGSVELWVAGTAHPVVAVGVSLTDIF